MKAHFRRVFDSKFREWMRDQTTDSERRGNAYGLVVRDYEGGELPVTCAHGGSGWLCVSCAESIMEGAE